MRIAKKKKDKIVCDQYVIHPNKRDKNTSFREKSK
jgi:hypothetical protein